MSTQPLGNAGASAASSSVVTQSLHVPAPAEVDRWPNCTPQLVLNMLKALLPTEMGANSKLLPNSYRFWAQMNEGQVRTTLQFWDRLPADKRVSIVAQVAVTTTQAVVAVAATAANASQEVPIVKHDLCRMLHVRMDPSMAMAWAATRQGYKDRRVLDARHATSAPNGLGGSLAEDADPWGRIAERFMDYAGFQPQNQLIAYENDAPVRPYRPADHTVTGLAAVCNELRPTLMTRKDFMRDGSWCKTAWSKLKGTLSAIFTDFERSGEHRSGDMADVEWNDSREMERWVRKCNINHRTYPDVSAYAYGIMERGDFEGLGKTQAPGAGRDDSVAGAGEGSAAMANGRRKNRQANGKRPREVAPGDDGIGAALIAAAHQDNRCDIFKFTAMHGNTAEKAAAMKALNNFALRGTFDDPKAAPPVQARRRRSSSSAASHSSAASGLSGDSDSGSDCYDYDRVAVEEEASVGSRSSVYGGGNLSGRLGAAASGGRNVQGGGVRGPLRD
ncbi:hypothetical protein B484DRAFT_397394 [Ochromonadaceae sp. CCMP2298]|nr:hypothetical protein B484DRAFT_397394 [Ochromonadaceae sp. CCMP2298]